MSAESSPPSSGQEPSSRASRPVDFHPENIAELRDSKQDLILKVQAMKKELSDWRGRVDGQVRAYRSELGELQSGLASEMGGLRGELASMKERIRAQLAASGEAVADLQRRGGPPSQHLPGGAGAAAGTSSASGP